MKAVIHVNSMEHQQAHGAAMQRGLAAHGVQVVMGHWNQPEVCDFAVMWGWNQPAVSAAAPHTLVMERGHVGDRMKLASCGWDGLARRGRYKRAEDSGARWRARFGSLLQPWVRREGYALVIGQVDGDAALHGLDMPRWIEAQEDALVARGWPVRYRPHPAVSKPARSLEQDLAGAALCVTFNSTTGVEAVLSGIPTVTMDEGAMAYEVTGHNLDEIVRPDRIGWAHDLAWTTWDLAEIAAGDVWSHLLPLMEVHHA